MQNHHRQNRPIGLLKKTRYYAEYMLLQTLLGVFSLMSPDQSVRFAAKIGRFIGPKLGANRIALANLKQTMPYRPAADYQKILEAMWGNLASLIAEYPNLEFFAPDVELAGIEHLKAAFEKHGQVIVFSGHIANWEMMAPCLMRYGVPIDLVYRAPNNPYSDRMLNRYRTLHGKLRTLPKSKTGTRKLVQALKDGRSIGILIDQKYNEGIAVPFMGRPAMTSPAFVQLAQKFNCGLVPFRVERLTEPMRFRLSFYEALNVFDDNNAPLPPVQVIDRAHSLLESWIREKPEEWIWLHRRWIPEKAGTAKPDKKNRKPKNAPPRPVDQPPPAA